MSSFSSAPFMLRHFLLTYWNPFEFVLAMTFTKHLRFYVERRKEYLHGFNDRNVVDPAFPRLIGIRRFLDALGCRVTIPKASVAAELAKPRCIPINILMTFRFPQMVPR
jgi:hypothetical protein